MRRIDYPIHEQIAQFQDAILSRTLSHLTLNRIQDGEAKAAAGEDVYTLPEHLKAVMDSVFTELAAPPAGEFNNRTPYINSFRRALQRSALKKFADIVAKPASAQPEDARVLTRMYLTDLATKIDAALGKADLKLDDYTRAHLTDSRLRIKQILEAESSDFGKPASGGGGGFFILGAESAPRTSSTENITEQP